MQNSKGFGFLLKNKAKIIDIRMIAQGTIDKDIYDIIERKESASELVKKIKGVKKWSRKKS